MSEKPRTAFQTEFDLARANNKKNFSFTNSKGETGLYNTQTKEEAAKNKKPLTPFQKAFDDARKAGQTQFKFTGKDGKEGSFSTERKGFSPAPAPQPQPAPSVKPINASPANQPVVNQLTSSENRPTATYRGQAQPEQVMPITNSNTAIAPAFDPNSGYRGTQKQTSTPITNNNRQSQTTISGLKAATVSLGNQGNPVNKAAISGLEKAAPQAQPEKKPGLMGRIFNKQKNNQQAAAPAAPTSAINNSDKATPPPATQVVDDAAKQREYNRHQSAARLQQARKDAAKTLNSPAPVSKVNPTTPVNK
jgi:hypothetical protein